MSQTLISELYSAVDILVIFGEKLISVTDTNASKNVKIEHSQIISVTTIIYDERFTMSRT